MNTIGHLRRQARMNHMLELMNSHPDWNLNKKCQEVGIKVETYHRWRAEDADFKAKCDQINRGRFKKDDPLVNGQFGPFRDKYFPTEYPSAPFHYEIVRIIENAPPMSVTMILVPPNFGKSTLLEDYINWKLALDPNHRFTIVSKSQQQARKMLGKVARRMTDIHQFGAYVAKYGPFRLDGQEKVGKPWTRDYFTVAKSDHDERDYSLQVLGWSGQVYGSRIDTLILDDIQTRDNLTSVEEMLNKFSLEYMTRGDAASKVIIIGTRIEVGDIYEQLIENGVVNDGQLFIMPAVHLDENGDQVSLWPERWPMDILDQRRRQIGEKAWWCGFMMAPQRGGSATFTEEMVERAKNPTRAFGRLRDVQAPVVLGLDPALGGGNGIVALAYSSDRIWVLDAVREAGLARTEDILERLEQFALAYRPTDVVIENVAFQRGLARDDRMQSMASRYGFTVHEHATNRNKQDPILGVGSMAGSFSRNEMDIPWGDEYTKDRMKTLIAELLSWRPELPTKMLEQDLVMAMWFAWLHIMERRRTLGMDTTIWTRAGLAQSTPYASSLSRAGSGGYL